MDRTRVCGILDEGSIPSGVTAIRKSTILVLFLLRCDGRRHVLSPDKTAEPGSRDFPSDGEKNTCDHTIYLGCLSKKSSIISSCFLANSSPSFSSKYLLKKPTSARSAMIKPCSAPKRLSSSFINSGYVMG